MIAEYTAQGSVAQVRRVALTTRKNKGGGLRGRITEFSRASRRRLVDLMARLDVRRVRVTFLTLTFSGTPSPEEAAAAFKRFRARLSRWFPEASAVWRRERQERGSFHYHLLIFSLPYVPQFWLQDTWTACTQEVLSIVDVRRVRSRRHVMAYVSKYIAKVDSPPVPPSLENPAYQHASAEASEGRAWGVINQDSLPMAELLSVLVEDDQMTAYFFAAVRKLSHGRSGGSDRKAALYCEDAYEMVSWALDRARRAGVEVQRDLYRIMAWKAQNASSGA